MKTMDLILAHENAKRIVNSVRELSEFQAEQEKAKYRSTYRTSKRERREEAIQRTSDYILRNEKEQNSHPTTCFSSLEELRRAEAIIAKHYSNEEVED